MASPSLLICCNCCNSVHDSCIPTPSIVSRERDLIRREPSRRYYIFVSNRFSSLTSFQEYRNFVSSDTATRNLDRLPCAAKREKKNTMEYVFPLENSQTIVHHSSASGKIPFFFPPIPRLLFINGGQRKGLNSTVLRVLLMLARGNSTKPLSSATLIPPVSLVSHPRSLNFAPL